MPLFAAEKCTLQRATTQGAGTRRELLAELSDLGKRPQHHAGPRRIEELGLHPLDLNRSREVQHSTHEFSDAQCVRCELHSGQAERVPRHKVESPNVTRKPTTSLTVKYRP